jgi:hypothetical protein
MPFLSLEGSDRNPYELSDEDATLIAEGARFAGRALLDLADNLERALVRDPDLVVPVSISTLDALSAQLRRLLTQKPDA